MENQPPTKRATKSKILRKTIISKYTKSLEQLIESVQVYGMNSDILLVLINIYHAGVASLAAFLTSSSKVWSEGSSLYNLLYLVSFIWKYGMRDNDQTQFNKHTLMTIVLTLCVYCLLVLTSLVFMRRIHLHKAEILISMALAEIYLPCAIPSYGTPLALQFYLLINSSSARSSMMTYIYIILFICLIVCTTLFLSRFIFNQVSFCPSRSMCWVGSKQCLTIAVSSVNCFVTRYMELQGGTAAIVGAFIYIIGNSIVIVMSYRVSIFIRPHQFSFFVSLLSSGVATMFVSLLILFGVDIPRIVLVIVYTVIFVESYFSSTIYNKYFTSKVLKTLDNVHEGNISFDSAFKNKRIFMIYAELGFSFGHPAILTWELMNKALQRWNNDTEIYILYIRFLAVYYSENQELQEVCKKCKSKFHENGVLKFFHRRALRLAQGRSHSGNDDTRTRIESIEKKSRELRRSLSTYWIAMEKQQVNDSFNQAINCCYLDNEIEKEYGVILTRYPNKPFIYFHYAKFQRDIICNNALANQMRSKGELLNAGVDNYVDQSQKDGLMMFPFLPSSIKSDKKEEIFTVSDNDESKINTSIVQANTETDNSSSEVFALGSRAPIPSKKFINISFFVLFVMTMIIGAFVPTLIIYSGYEAPTKVFAGLSIVKKFEKILMSTEFFFVVEASRQCGTFPSESDLFKELNYSSSGNASYYSQIVEQIANLDSVASKLFSMIGTNVSVSTDGGTYIVKSNCQVIYVEGEHLSYPINSSFIEALGTAISNAHMYSSGNSNLSSATWLSSMIQTNEQLDYLLSNVSSLLSSDITSEITSIMEICITISVVVGVASALSLLFPVLSFASFHRCWTIFVSAISSLPNIAVRKTIEKFQNSGKSKGEETKDDPNTIDMLGRLESFVDKSGSSICSFLIPGFILVGVSFACIVIVNLLSVTASNTIKEATESYYSDTRMMKIGFSVLTYMILDSSIAYGTGVVGIENNTVLSSLNSLGNRSIKYLDEFFSYAQNGVNGGSLNGETSILSYDKTALSNAETTAQFEQNLSDSLFLETSFMHIFNALSLALCSPSQPILPNNTDLHWAIFNFGYKLLPNLFSTIVSDNDETTNSGLSTVKSETLITSLITFAIGALLTIAIGASIRRTISAAMFSLCSLSMISGRAVLNSLSFSKILAGQYSNLGLGESILGEEYHEVSERIEDAAAVLSSDMFVVEENSSMHNLLHSDAKGVHISTLLVLEKQSIEDDLAEALRHENQINTVGHYETKVRILSTEEEFSAIVDTYVTFSEISGRKAIIMLKKNSAEKITLSSIEEEKRKADQIRSIAIPQRLQKMIDITKKVYFISSSNIVIGFINIRGVNSKEFFSIVKEIEKAVSETEDGFVARSYGKSVMVVFNSALHKSNYKHLFQNCIDFERKACASVPKGKAMAACSLCIAKNSVIGVIAEDLANFQLYAKSMQMAYLAAKCAEGGKIAISNDVYNNLQENEVSNSQEAMMRIPVLHESSFYYIPL